MKACRGCGQKKNLKEFYRHSEMKDGHLGFCKECVRTRVIKHRQDNINRIRTYDQIRHKAKNMTTEGREERRKSNSKWRRADKRRLKAHNAVARKLKHLRPSECSLCGKEGRVVGHHPDYSKPLEVIWCCTPCHATFRNHKAGE